MAIGTDPERLRDRARAVRAWSAEVAVTADRVRSGHGVRWVGAAADRHHERLHRHAQDIEAARTRVGDVARDLDVLADDVEQMQAAIRRAMAVVEDTMDQARRTVGRLGSIAADALSDHERYLLVGARHVLGTVGPLPAAGVPAWIDLARRITS